MVPITPACSSRAIPHRLFALTILCHGQEHLLEESQVHSQAVEIFMLIEEEKRRKETGITHRCHDENPSTYF